MSTIAGYCRLEISIFLTNMRFHWPEILKALSLAYLLLLVTGLQKVVTQGKYIHYNQTFLRADIIGAEISNRELAKYAKDAYFEMVRQWNAEPPASQEENLLPAMMAAMWIPADGEITVGSSAKNGSDFGYNPPNVPIQVTALLRTAQHVDKWCDEHHTGGSCAEIVCLAVYFERHSERQGLPRPQGAQMVAFGKPKYGPPSVQKPCTGKREEERGCRDFLKWLGIKWCAPQDVGGPLLKRDAISDVNFTCNNADTPANLTNLSALSITSPSSTTIEDDSTSMVDNLNFGTDISDIEAFVANGITSDDSTTLSTGPTLTTEVASVNSAPASAAEPVEASKIVGNQTEMARSCTQACVAGFQYCTSGQNKGAKQNANSMDCYALANCYGIRPPYQAAPSPEAGVISNPQDPEAKLGPAAKPKIDTKKADDLCSEVSI